MIYLQKKYASLLLALLSFIVGIAQVSIAEREALIALYNATDGDNWTNTVAGEDPWLINDLSSDVANWYGVTVSGNSVTNISLNNNNLNGEVPSQIGDLVSLQRLDLSRNAINGELSTFIDNLSPIASLTHLVFPTTDIQGEIPESFANLSNLTWLQLQSNPNISGPISPIFRYLPKLSTFSATGCGFTEVFDLNTEYTIHENISSLNFGSNENIEGVLDFGKYFPNVTSLKIGGNNFNGEFSDYNFNDLKLLRVFTADQCGLKGSIPSDKVFESLYWLSIRNNELSGTLPDVFNNGNTFGYFRVDYNNLSGKINLPPLSREAVVSNNNFVFNDFIEDYVLDDLLYYTNQEDVEASPNQNVFEGEELVINAHERLQHPNNIYSWYKDGELVSNNKDLSITNVTLADAGSYSLTITNPTYPELTLTQEATVITVEESNNDCVSAEEKAALIDLYNSTDGANWTTSTNWLSDQPVSEWYGVTVVDCKVTEVDLGYNNLVGNTSNFNVFYSLRNLLDLDLAGNAGIVGSIPSSFGSLINLQDLDFGSCSLSGSIPDEIGGMISLKKLSLVSNKLSGSIPDEIGNLVNLQYLYLTSNELTGSIPDEIGNLKKLWYLWLGRNELSGSIPDEIGDLESLVSIQLFSNKFTGDIPNEIESLTNLTNIQAFSNELTSIPNEIVSLTNLTNLQLQDNKLSGQIPLYLQELTNLENLYLDNNSYTILPTEFVGFENLENYTISYNNLSGKISSSLFELSNLNKFFYQGNAFVFDDMDEQVFQLSFRNYNPQKNIPASPNQTISEGDALTIQANERLLDEDNQYQWLKDGVEIAGDVAKNKDYTISAVALADEGSYSLQITNTTYPGLTLIQEATQITVTEAIDTCGVSEEEKTVLWSLYESTDGPNWTNTLAGNQPWSLEIPVCDWYGVTVSEGSVTELKLKNNNLTGLISQELGNLSSLIILQIDNNDLTGTIPNQLGQLSNLKTLELYGNELTGQIPAEIGDLNNLETLSLNSNNLTGSIPDELGNLQNIQYIYLQNNSLQDGIPALLGNLSTLKTLNLAFNPLGGEIPTELGNLSSVETIYINSINLQGSIPASFGDLTNLRRLYAFNNSLEGTIPVSINQLVNLETFFVYNNNLHGDIPIDYSDLTRMKYLRFHGNNFVFSDFEDRHNAYSNTSIYSYSPQANVDNNETLSVAEGSSITLTSAALTSPNNTYQWFKDGVAIGTPTSTKELVIENATEADAGEYYFTATNSIVTDLTLTRNTITLEVTVAVDTCGVSAQERAALVALYNNTDGANWTNIWDLNEPVCDWYGVTVEQGNVTKITLRRNNLDGTIPSELANLQSLTDLAFETNNLTGEIPPELGNLNLLTSMGFGSNNLSGEIPPELGNLSSLTYFSFFNNNLSGEIPSELSNINSLTYLGVGSNNLTGEIPTELGSLSSLKYLILHNNNLTGTIPPELGNLSSLTNLGLTGNNLTGPIPAELGNLASLQILDINSNDLTGEIPSELINLSSLYRFIFQDNNLSGKIPSGFDGISSFDVLWMYNNNFVFSDFENEHLSFVNNIEKYTYSPQAKVDQEEALSVAEGESITLSSTALTSPNNTYQWFKDGVAIGTPTNTKELVIENATEADAGEYYFTATNSIVTDLTLTRNTITLEVTVAVDTCGVSEEEKAALWSLYESTNGPNWTNTLAGDQPWSLEIPVCDWYGVTVSEGSVTQVKLDRNSLTGSIPETISDLKNVTYLELAHNDISGPIPDEIGLMSSLQTLLLELNDLSGSIPSSIGDLTNLTQLKLGYNSLTGTIPVEIGNLTRLYRFNINGNQISGSIPKEISNLSNLIFFYAISNQLSGEVPVELSTLSSLRYLWLGNNQLTGEIPPQLGNLSSLVDLHFNNNLMTGLIPVELGNLTKLDRLNLSGNQFEGYIPDELANMTVVKSLYFNDNNFSGSIPSEFLSLSNLQNLSFNNNSFVYSDFEEEHQYYANNLTTYNNSPQANVDQTETLLVQQGESVTLTSAALTSPNNTYQWFKDGVAIGTPTTTKELVIENPTEADAGEYYFTATNSIVTDLTLTRNTITLVVSDVVDCVSPEEKGALWAFYQSTNGQNWTNTLAGDQAWSLDTPVSEWYGITLNSDCDVIGLDLYRNEVTGTIPTQIAGLVNLRSLILTNNSIEGEIPDSICSLINLSTLRLGANKLTGKIPDDIGNLVNLTELFFLINELSGDLPRSISKLVNITGVHLNSNKLTGDFSFLFELPKVTSIVISKNLFDEEFSLDNDYPINTNLIGLTIYQNNLSGIIDFGKYFPNLRSLNFSNNNFNGEFSEYGLTSLNKLTGLSFSDNQIYGQITNDIGNLSSLSSLLIGANNLTGKIPLQLLNIDSLNLFWAYSNNFVFSDFEEGFLEYGSRFRYNPQANLPASPNQEALKTGTFIIPANERLVHPNNQYQWYKQNDSGNFIALENATNKDLSVNNVTETDAGIYQLRITNDTYPDLTLIQEPTTITVIELTGDECASAAEKVALWSLYQSTRGDNWTNTTEGNKPWDLNTPVCDWYGISTGEGQVKSVSLLNNNLNGYLPTNLGNLINIFSFNVSNNTLTAHPVSNAEYDFSGLSVLQNYDISNNQISGSQPQFAGYLSLNVVNNNFVFDDFQDDYASYNITHIPQANLPADPNQTVVEGEGFIIRGNERLQHPQNTYQWYKLSGDGVFYTPIANATSKDFEIVSSSTLNQGTYKLEIKNDLLGNSIAYAFNQLVLTQEPTTITIQQPVDECGVSAEEKAALWSLYQNTNGDNWTNTTQANQPWDLDIPVCDWFGVTVEGGVVTELELNNNNLSGEIPSLLFDLVGLVNLNLQFNALVEEIPSNIIDLTNLQYLYLDNNQFSGNMPIGIENMTNLLELFFNHNQLDGTIPLQIGNLSNLTRLGLNNNKLTSVVPSSLSSITNLKELYLNNNQLSGEIPTGIGELPNLESFYVNTNKFVFDNLDTLFFNVNTFGYSTQANLEASPNQNLYVGDALIIPANTLLQHPNNVYNWYKDGELVSTDKDLNISSVTTLNSGSYHLVITNPTYPDLTLTQETTTVVIQNDIALLCEDFPYRMVADVPIPNGGSTAIWYEDDVYVDGQLVEDEILDPDDEVYPGMELYAAVDGSSTRTKVTLPTISGVPGSYDEEDEEDYQIFYTSENPNPTIADLKISPNGIDPEDITWHISEDSMVNLEPSTPLEDGATYYAANNYDTCRFNVEVSITPGEIELDGYPVFCASQNPTIADLENEVVYQSFGSEVRWYSTPEGGSPLPSNTSLVNDTTYYATLSDGTNEVATRQDVYVTILSVPNVIIEGSEQIVYVYEHEEPQIKHIKINGTENLVWYLSPDSSDQVLPEDYPLEDGVTYYATQYFSGQLCESDQLVAVKIKIEILPPPKIILCEKFRPNVGQKYVFNSWVRQQGVEKLPSSVTKELPTDEEAGQLLIDLLNHILTEFVLKVPTGGTEPTQIVVPDGYIPEPQTRKYDPLRLYVEESPTDILTIYNFRYIYEDPDDDYIFKFFSPRPVGEYNYKRAVGFEFSFNDYPEGTDADVTYLTPFYNTGTDAIPAISAKYPLAVPAVPPQRYPLFHNHNPNNLSLSFSRFSPSAVNNGQIVIDADFKINDTSTNMGYTLLNSNTTGTSTNGTLEIKNLMFSREFNEYVPDLDYQVMDYASTLIDIVFEDENEEELEENGKTTIEADGVMIDGWQKVTTTFIVPNDANYISINLKNTSNDDVNSYFDDIRVHPYDSNLKTYVYDPITQQLRAELDENNFATFYEYDNEGGLIRVKKETERGIYTIQETRSGNSKYNKH